MADKPIYTIVAGPNGAGKSTLTQSGRFEGAAIVDPDDLARRMNPDNPEQATYQAGKEALRMIDNNIETGRDFVQETTLAGTNPIRTAERAIAAGFGVELHFVGLNNVQKSHDRVADRVAQGGHDIPAADIERRYEKTFENAAELAKIADRTVLYDNSSPDAEHAVVYERDDRIERLAPDAPAWAGSLAERDRADRREADPGPIDGEKEKPPMTDRQDDGDLAKDREDALDDRAEDLHRKSVQAMRDGLAEIDDPAKLAMAKRLIERMEETGKQFREGRAADDRDSPEAREDEASKARDADAERQTREAATRAASRTSAERDAMDRQVAADVTTRDRVSREEARIEREIDREDDFDR